MGTAGRTGTRAGEEGRVKCSVPNLDVIPWLAESA